MHNTKNALAYRGGQHHIGLFGIGNARRPQATPPPKPKIDDQPSRVNGMTFAQRRARVDAWVTFAAPPQAAATAGGREAHETLVATMSAAQTHRAKEAAREREDRQEWEEHDAQLRAQTTPAMRAAAVGAQSREERRWHAAARQDQDESYAAFLRYWFPHCNALMAQEGA